jgi:hypothetical protein
LNETRDLIVIAAVMLVICIALIFLLLPADNPVLPGGAI